MFSRIKRSHKVQTRRYHTVYAMRNAIFLSVWILQLKWLYGRILTMDDTIL